MRTRYGGCDDVMGEAGTNIDWFDCNMSKYVPTTQFGLAEDYFEVTVYNIVVGQRNMLYGELLLFGRQIVCDDFYFLPTQVFFAFPF